MNYSIKHVNFDPLLPDPKDLAYANTLEQTAWRYIWASLALSIAIIALGAAARTDEHWIIAVVTATFAWATSLIKIRRCTILARRIRLGRAIGVGKRLFKYRERRAKRFW